MSQAYNIAMLCIFLSLLSLIWIIYRLDKDKKYTLMNTISLTVFICCFILTPVLIINDTYENMPKAIDVYRGNTELKIIYKIDNNNDTLSIDSTVIFKDFINGE